MISFKHFKHFNFLKVTFMSLSIITLTACGGGDGDGNDYNDYHADIKCPTNMTCGYMNAPKDYNNINGETVKVFYGVHKHESESVDYKGILLFNFGGPGGSSVRESGYMAEYFLPPEILNNFDIVGMDPRGSGGSAFADDLANCAIKSHKEKDDNFESCQATFKKVAPYMGSNTIVQDMDTLRVHLNQPKLNFFGYSYGTRIGALYAQAYPQNVGAFVLDSISSPNDTNFLKWLLGDSAGRDLIVKHRLGEDESLFNIPRPRKDFLEKMVSNNDEDNLNLYNVTNDEGRTVVDALQSREEDGYWSQLKSSTIATLDNKLADATFKLQASVIQQQKRTKEDRKSPQRKVDDLRADAMFAAVVCTDESEPVTEQQRLASKDEFLTSSKIYGESFFNFGSKMCVNWPAKTDPISFNENQKIAMGVHILMIGGEYDTATAYKGVLEMKKLFDNPTLLTVNNYVTHGFSYTFHIEWLDNLTTSYLLNPDNPMQDQEGSKDDYWGMPTKSLHSNGVTIFSEQPINPARKVRMGAYSPKF